VSPYTGDEEFFMSSRALKIENVVSVLPLVPPHQPHYLCNSIHGKVLERGPVNAGSGQVFTSSVQNAKRMSTDTISSEVTV